MSDMKRHHEDAPDHLPPGVNARIHRQLQFAIANKRLIHLNIDGRIRIGEPHDYGILRGRPTLLLYQTSGYSASGGLPSWRMIAVPTIADVQPLDEGFPGSRQVEARRHHEWDELFIRVDSA
jgi:hypothetical protein